MANFGKLKSKSAYFAVIWYMLKYFVDIWCIVFHFGILYKDNSGNSLRSFERDLDLHCLVLFSGLRSIVES
jgi:hypothetical protein